MKPEDSQRNRTGRDRVEREASRKDPADPRPVAAYVSTIPELSIDERIRVVVEAMRPNLSSSAPDPEELLLLEDAALEDDHIISEHQAQEMALDAPETDVEGFLATLTEEERAILRQAVTEDEPPPSSPAEPGEAAGAGDTPE